MSDTRLPVRFEDGADLLMTPDQIASISYDLASWVGYMRMLAGGPPARMQACMDGEKPQAFTVYRHTGRA